MMGTNSSAQDNLELRKAKNKEEMKKQVMAFALSIFLTIVAFIAVASDVISHWFTIPFILLLAIVQVVFQLYYFMHLKHKGHEAPALFMWSAVAIAAVMIAALVLVVWI